MCVSIVLDRGTLLPCTWALAVSASTGGMTAWTTVVALQDQATLERGQTMAVSTHNALRLKLVSSIPKPASQRKAQ